MLPDPNKHRFSRDMLNGAIMFICSIIFSLALLFVAVRCGPWFLNTILKVNLTDKDAIYYTLVALVPASITSFGILLKE